MRLAKWISFAFIATLIVSCYPEKDRTVEDFDIIGTNYDSDTDFNTLKTYYLQDSVVVVYNPEEDKPEYPLAEAEVILSGIRANLNTLGWVEVTDTTAQAPDVHMISYIMTVKVEGVNYYPGWGYYNPWYPGYYPGYGGGVSYYSYTTGTILVDMLDLNKVNSDDEVNIAWTGAMNGLVSSDASNLNRIEYSVNQIFEQSPYLKK